jgi:Fur family iron response transcriptional regulator
MLRDVGLRPTRQRMALGWMLFSRGNRHVTAEMLYEEANKAKVPMSLATIYNTLQQFTYVGLLRQIRCLRVEDLFRHQRFSAPSFLY